VAKIRWATGIHADAAGVGARTTRQRWNIVVQSSRDREMPLLVTNVNVGSGFFATARPSCRAGR
jgi:hypothetical protein